MKLLILSSRFPYPIEKGDKLRLFYQIQQLSQIFKIVLVCISDRPVPSSSIAKLSPYCTDIHVFRISWPGILANLVIGFLQGLPLQIAYFVNPFLKRKIARLILESPPDHIYCQLIRAAEYVKNIPIPKTLDYMDCFSHGTYKRRQNSGMLSKWFWSLEASRLSEYESTIYSFFDSHTVISSQDGTLLKLQQNQPLTVISNGLSPDFDQDLPDTTRYIDLLFLGNLQYYSNIQAVNYLINDILPLFTKPSPQMQVVIAGAEPGPVLVKWVANSPYPVSLLPNPMTSRDIYLRAKVFVAPITLGTGQQNKVLEALASGCKVVCSKEVSEGLPSLKNHLMIADRAEQYASLITGAVNAFNSSDMSTRAAVEDVRKLFSWKQNTAPLINLLQTGN